MSESDSDSGSISKLLEESGCSPELPQHSTMDSDSDSDSESDSNSNSRSDSESSNISEHRRSDSEEPTPPAADEDIDDFEDPTDEGKYSAPEYLRKSVKQLVKEIDKIVKRNPSKESRRSSTGGNSRNGRKSQSVSEKQKEIADEMLEKMILRKIPQIKSKQFQYFDMFIIVPYFHSLGKSN